ncbi:TPA: hypothetical protein NI776_001851 [Pseudomonas aeruginosa]|nr:hypothetical protein [Pseudomonas aeruginosa]
MSLQHHPIDTKLQIGERLFIHVRPGWWREDHPVHGNRVTRPTCSLERMEEACGAQAVVLPADHGYFVDWNGDARLTAAPGDGFSCQVNVETAHVDVVDSEGFVVHECSFFRTFESMNSAGIDCWANNPALNKGMNA